MNDLIFIRLLQKELRRHLPSCADIRFTEQQGRDSIEITTPADQLYPSISLSRSYQDYLTEKAPSRIATRLLEIYGAEGLHPVLAGEDLPDKPSFLSGLRLQPCSLETGRGLMRDTPQHIRYGMCFLFTVRADGDLGILGDAPVTREMLSRFRVRESRLLSASLANLQREEPPCIMPLGDFTEKLRLSLPEEDSCLFPHREDKRVNELFVLTNHSAYLGAGVLLYPGLIDTLHRRFGDFYLLPCSIHELIILPLRTGAGPQRLRRLIRQVNAASEDRFLVLSDELYLCTAGEGLRICS